MERVLEKMWENGPFFYQTDAARLTTDTVLLADFARVKGSERGADLGCASGALMLLLLWREPRLSMTGFEISPDAVALARENIFLNGLEGRADLACGDFRTTVQELAAGGYDFIISNPPYFESGRGALAPDDGRAAARAELCCSIGEVCAAAARLCRSGGRVFFSYRPEGLNRLLAEMTGARLEPKRLRFVHHRRDKESFLVLVEGRKDGNPGLKAEAPLILYTDQGEESEEYRRIYHR